VAAPERWIVYACRTPYALDIAEILWRCGRDIAYVVDNLPDPPPSEIGPVCTPADLPSSAADLAVVIPQMTPGHRLEVHEEAVARGLTRFPVLVDPHAVVARTASLGEGVVVNTASVVAAGSQLARFVQINRSASVGHHNVLDEYASVGPGAVLAGHVHVGPGAFIGSGAVCAPEVRIGANAVVGAGAVVVHDVAPNTVVVGNPARVLREDIAGYGDVAVPAPPG